MSTEVLTPEQNPYAEQGLLDELAGYHEMIPATLGQRFLNYLIDNIFMRYVLTYITGYVIGIFIANMNAAPNSFDSPDYWTLVLIGYAVTILNYLLYYTICEVAFKGYTLGKLITGTKAVTEEGQPLTFKTALLRSLVRLIPFEPFSAFGRQPWHDSLTNTKVIKTR